MFSELRKALPSLIVFLLLSVSDAFFARTFMSLKSNSGKGFGTKIDEIEPRPDLKVWEKEYKGFVRRCGAYICSLSWHAYEKMGRGAIYANYDGGKKANTLSEADSKFGGVPSMFCPLKEFEDMKPLNSVKNEHTDLNEIIRRVKEYDPEREFVVVFQVSQCRR
mmetsp:Transcript_5668/g.8520  ORF Transcript_5668/g.8520 Transcript_5668/m.8520 type:complete len:164 (+) Transcript_5668:37-528(+)